MKVFGSWRDWAAAETDLAGKLSQDAVAALGRAYAFAEPRHAGQTRPAGEPYTWHLLEALEIAVDSGMTDADVLVATLLHDIVEDTPTGLDEVRARFGAHAAELVGWVTKPEPAVGEDPAEIRGGYLARFADAPVEVLTVKLADRYSNVQRLGTHPRPAKRASYYAETVRHFVPLAARVPYFEGLFSTWRASFAYLVS
jgi:guanosine-3',5'-bis(diphosphate) 3'-pyrophosphohydrolase